MRLFVLDHLSVSAYLSTTLVIAAGCLFGFLCLLMLLAEFVVKLIFVPIIFSFAMASLAYGLLRRKILQKFYPA